MQIPLKTRKSGRKKYNIDAIGRNPDERWHNSKNTLTELLPYEFAEFRPLDIFDSYHIKGH